MPKPNFTAFVVMTAQLATARLPKYAGLVPEQTVRLSRIFLDACCVRDRGMALLRRLPDAVKLWIMDGVIVEGMSLHLVLRKRLIEGQVREAIAQGTQQVVVIGAGFDTLALRLAPEFPQVGFWEIDVAATQQIKQNALAGWPVSGQIHFTPTDLATEQLEDVLNRDASYSKAKKTLFIAEGLTMYLTADDNARLFQSVRNLAAAGSVFLVTAVEKLDTGADFGEKVRGTILRRRGESFTWSIPREKMDEFLGAYGWNLQQSWPYAELQREFRSTKEMIRLQRKKGEHVYLAMV